MREWLQRCWRALVAPRMLYGWRGADGRWLAHTRISTGTRIESPERLAIGDHVYVGPFNLLDASGGLHIGEGVQITTHCALLTHSSHQAVRLAGRNYWGDAEPPGFVRRATQVGAYSFIGPHSVVMPGSRIGRGVIVKAYSYVDGELPDFAIAGGQPAVVLGDTREADRAWLDAHPAERAAYDAWALKPTDEPPR
ncbi:MAG: acyltransferase [Proteobacteria bacterium]|nr:acyltransferase [Pseudomonadota bacterium]